MAWVLLVCAAIGAAVIGSAIWRSVSEAAHAGRASAFMIDLGISPMRFERELNTMVFEIERTRPPGFNPRETAARVFSVTLASLEPHHFVDPGMTRDQVARHGVSVMLGWLQAGKMGKVAFTVSVKAITDSMPHLADDD